jgi:hypothetical protein
MKSVSRSVRKDGSKQAFSLLYLMTVHIGTVTLMLVTSLY